MHLIQKLENVVAISAKSVEKNIFKKSRQWFKDVQFTRSYYIA
jgi:hypothetical protein